MSAKPESVIHGWASSDIIERPLHVAEIMGFQEFGDEIPCTVLLHGENGEVGGLEAGYRDNLKAMLKWLEKTNPSLGIQDFSVIYLYDLLDALSHILGGSV